MCGIIGYTGTKRALPILLEGLHRLEYRGYDSAGVVVQGGSVVPDEKHASEPFTCEKRAGKISVLRESLRGKKIMGHVGLGHTRWATHGIPNARNAHPHLSCGGTVAVVHNGIIENHEELRAMLKSKGHQFSSDTDTEVITHLVEHYYRKDPVQAVHKAIQKLKGSYGLGVLFKDHFGFMVAARLNSPLVIGFGKGEQFVASDVAALLPFTKNIAYIKESEIVLLDSTSVQLFDSSLKPRKIQKTKIAWAASVAEKAGYPHYMLKEINEQPEVVKAEITGRIVRNRSMCDVSDTSIGTQSAIRGVNRIIVAACGTASYAGTYGKYVFEELAHLPTEVAFASEFRYGSTPIDRKTLLIAVSQSGETADTLAAARMAKEKGATVFAITNVKGSSLSREADWVMYMRAGLEIGVAATKSYVSQLMCMALSALHFGTVRKTLPEGRRKQLIKELLALPAKMETVVRNTRFIKKCAVKYHKQYDFMYVGRGYNLATAYEGALKMKEISYLHAEGYGAGEMKHGPLALVDKNMAAIGIIIKGRVYDKILSNIEEIKVRKGHIIGVLCEGDTKGKQVVDHVFEIPAVDELLSPVLAVVPLQLLSYYTAVKLGCDVDQPRNLAKSVTVE